MLRKIVFPVLFKDFVHPRHHAGLGCRAAQTGEKAYAHARDGIFKEYIKVDVSAIRLQRFFISG